MEIKETVFGAKRYLKSRKGKLLLETALYGLLATIYTSLFFFGALYPQFGIPSQSISCEAKEGESAEETENPGTDEEETETVVYKSLFLERLKEWF